MERFFVKSRKRRKEGETGKSMAKVKMEERRGSLKEACGAGATSFSARN